jgi:hypothetical protein
MMSYLQETVAAQVYKTEMNGRWGTAALTIPLSAKFGTKIRRPVAVAQSV